MLSKKRFGFLFSCSFFAFSVLWSELVLMWFCTGVNALNIVLLFSVSLGLALSFLISVIPFEGVRKAFAISILIAIFLFFTTEILLWRSFGYFYPPETVFGMAGDVAGSYGSTIISTLKHGFLPVILLLLPIFLFFVFLKQMYLKPRIIFSRSITLVLVLLIHSSSVNAIKTISVAANASPTDFDYYTSEFDFNQAVPRFGLFSAVRLNTLYSLTGIPELIEEGRINKEAPENLGSEYNVSEFDFNLLADTSKDKEISLLSRYFSSASASEKNDFTGLFKGKNLIFICAEALSPYVIDKERTPTLYKLSNEGFYFENYYQPSFGESTSGGEYSLLCSQIPGRMAGENGLSMSLACDANLKYSIPGKFSENEYNCFGFHNNSYTYYSRNITHPKLGINWYGVGGCLVNDGFEKRDLKYYLSAGWPRSDSELIMSTSDILLSSEKPFFAYYLTVSGHNNYSFSENTQARKNRLPVETYDGSEQVKAYIACQAELEKAISSLINTLDEAEILDDTVIALSNDHYPYGLSSTWQGNCGQDKLSELAGKKLDNYERERGVFFIWNSGFSEAVKIEKPTCGVDVMPTILNLFGIDYDSRVLAGRDALSKGDGLVIFSDFSFISSKGSYFANTGKYIPKDSISITELKEILSEVKNRVKISRRVRKSNFFKYLPSS